MHIKSFSYSSLAINLVILLAFIYANLYLNENFIKPFIWLFWTFSIIALIGAFTKPTDFLFSKQRVNQAIYSELVISIVLVFFDYPILATVGFISMLLFAGSRSKERKNELG